MPLGFLISALLAAAAMLAGAAHAAPAAADEMRADPGAAVESTRGAPQPRECIAPGRGCVPRAGGAPPHPPEPGLRAPAGRIALPAAILALPSLAAPRAARPLSILFRNFRS